MFILCISVEANYNQIKVATFCLSHLLELVYFDLNSHIATPTFSRFEYYMTFIDNFSCYNVFQLLYHKNECFDVFKVFLVWAKNYIDHKLKIL